MSSEDYSVQISYKFGPALQNMLNVRADDPVELQANIDAFTDDTVSSIVNLGAKLDATAGVAQQFAAPAATPTSSGAAPVPAASASAAPVDPGKAACAHGPRSVVKTKKWTGYFCALPKGTPGTCKAVFEDPA